MIIIRGLMTTSFKQLSKTLTKILGEEKINIRYRIMGEEITYVDEKIGLYTESYAINNLDKNIDKHLFSCEFNGSFLEAGELVLKIGESLRKKGSESEFSIEIDEDDDIVFNFTPNFNI